jgi:large subunit ribosomal protein L22
MGQKANPRREAENEAAAIGNMIRVSPRKLGLLAGMIRGLDASKALAELSFSPKHAARDVKKVLQSAIANAENNHQLDVDRLYVAEASVGTALVMGRVRARARGRVGHVSKPFSKIKLVVRERDEENA